MKSTCAEFECVYYTLFVECKEETSHPKEVNSTNSEVKHIQLVLVLTEKTANKAKFDSWGCPIDCVQAVHVSMMSALGVALAEAVVCSQVLLMWHSPCQW